MSSQSGTSGDTFLQFVFGMLTAKTKVCLLYTSHERFAAFEAIREEFKAQFSEEELDEKAALIDRYYHDVEKAVSYTHLDVYKRQVLK